MSIKTCNSCVQSGDVDKTCLHATHCFKCHFTCHGTRLSHTTRYLYRFVVFCQFWVRSILTEEHNVNTTTKQPVNIANYLSCVALLRNELNLIVESRYV